VTVIAAIATGDRVLMAADSRISQRTTRIGSTEKIIRKTTPDGGEFLLAVAGRLSLLSIARHSLNVEAIPDQGSDEECDAWAYAVACALAELAVEAKPPVLDENGSVDGEALLACGSRLWLLDGQSATRIQGSYAIGSGAPEARGALYVINRFNGTYSDPASALAVAVGAACDLDLACGGPVQLYATPINALTCSDGAGDPPAGQN
jgi:hypothetical protein